MINDFSNLFIFMAADLCMTAVHRIKKIIVKEEKTLGDGVFTQDRQHWMPQCYVPSQWQLTYRHCGSAAPPYFNLILSVAFNIMIFSLILSLCLYNTYSLSLMLVATPQFMKKYKILFMGAHHSSSGVEFGCFVHVCIGSCTWGCKGEGGLSFPQS